MTSPELSDVIDQANTALRDAGAPDPEPDAPPDVVLGYSIGWITGELRSLREASKTLSGYLRAIGRDPGPPGSEKSKYGERKPCSWCSKVGVHCLTCCPMVAEAQKTSLRSEELERRVDALLSVIERLAHAPTGKMERFEYLEGIFEAVGAWRRHDVDYSNWLAAAELVPETMRAAQRLVRAFDSDPYLGRK